MHHHTVRQQRRARRPAWPALLALLGATLTAVPAAASGANATDQAGWTAVDATTLGKLRGGFTTPAGLEVSLGIERMVMLNGVVLAQTNVEIADLGRLGDASPEAARDALSSVQLVQNGAGNVAALAGTVAPATLVQNTLDGQRIDSSTVIHSSVNSIGLLTALNVQDSLREAISRAALSH